MRFNENVPISTFEQNNPSQIYLFLILNQRSLTIAPIDIIIDFNLPVNISSSVEEIRLGLLVTGSNFTINNQTNTQYNSNKIPIFHWQQSTGNISEPIEILPFGDQEYDNDKSLCKWDMNRWNRLFNGSLSNNISHVYFLKTSIPQLTFTFIDVNNISSLLTPYLNILYCIPYKLGITEIILIICSSTLVIVVVIIVYILHYLKGGDHDRARHFERYYHSRHDSRDREVRKNANNLRHRSSVVTVISKHDNENI